MNKNKKFKYDNDNKHFATPHEFGLDKSNRDRLMKLINEKLIDIIWLLLYLKKDVITV